VVRPSSDRSEQERKKVIEDAKRMLETVVKRVQGDEGGDVTDKLVHVLGQRRCPIVEEIERVAAHGGRPGRPRRPRHESK
jgi:hypothetical protein